MKLLWQKVLFTILLLSLVTPFSGFAQEVAPALDASKALDLRWVLLSEKLEQNELTAASDVVNELLTIRDSSGIGALPGYAAHLITLAKKAEALGERDRARVLFRWALKLAPQNPEVIWQALPVYKQYRLGTLFDLVKTLAVSLWSSPSRMLSLIQKSIYPLLLALSWTLYLVFLGTIAVELMSIFRVLALYVRPSLRALLVPALFLLLFALPIFLGFLWCLACWAVAIYVIIPERKKLSILSGILVLAWGVLIPITENLSSWLHSEPVERVLFSSEQPLRQDEQQRLTTELSVWNGDAVVRFKFAQLLRRAGQLEAAERVLSSLEKALGEQNWIAAERSVLYSLRGDYNSAERVVREVIESGHDSVEVLFNLSKIVFELNNTKDSRELFGKALRKSTFRVEELRKREEVLGIHDPRSYADVDLPVFAYLKAAIFPNDLRFLNAESKAAQVMRGCDPRMIAIVGILILLMHLTRHKSSRRIHPKGLFDGYQGGGFTNTIVDLIPGGMLFTTGRFRSGFLILFTMVVTAAPLIRGTYHTPMFACYGWLVSYHICFWLIIYLLVTLYSIQKGKE
jgi:tetratricopeptide (TPR) repeat protein